MPGRDVVQDGCDSRLFQEKHLFSDTVPYWIVANDGGGARVWYEPAGNRIGVDRLLGPEQEHDIGASGP